MLLPVNSARICFMYLYTHPHPQKYPAPDEYDEVCGNQDCFGGTLTLCDIFYMSVS